MKDTHRSNKALVLTSAIDAVERQALPESLLASQASLLKKLEAEMARQNSLHELTDEIYRAPSMGVIELSHESLPEGIALFATDIRTKDVVRLKLYSASKNLKTGQVVKGGLLYEMLMSETQFGSVLMNNGVGTGYPVTLLVDSGVDVEAYDEETDPTKYRMRELMEKILKPSHQVGKFMAELRELMDKMQADGKLGKKDGERMANLLSMISSHSVGNGVYTLTKLTEEMDKRTNEAVLNLNISGKQLLLSNKE